jgi:hypothetical protein
MAVLALDIVLLVVSTSPAAENGGEAEGYFFACVILGMFMLVADALAIGSVAMWQAMVEKRPRTAAGSAVLRILVLPWVLIGVIGMMAGAMGSMTSGATVLGIWFILGIVIDLGFANSAQQHLVTKFRIQAARRPEETLGIFGQLGRWLGRRV